MARSSFRTQLWLVGAAALLSGCASIPTTPPPPPPPSVMSWERVFDGGFENKGVAQVEQLNGRWTLRVACNGTHVTYLDATPIDLASYRGDHLRARYRWVERTEPDPRCIRQPCSNITTRLIALDSLERLRVTAVEAARLASDCRSPTPPPQAASDRQREPS